MCKDFREMAFEMSLKGQVDVCLCREGEKGRRMFPAEEPTFAKVHVTKKSIACSEQASSTWLEFRRHRDEKDMVLAPEEFAYRKNRHGKNQAIKCYLH